MADQDFVRYEEILFPSSEPFKSYSTNNSNSPNAIGPLSLINIFIGTNNSGKSRLLRSLFLLDKFNFTTNKYTAKEFYSFVNANLSDFKNIITHPSITRIDQIHPLLFEPILQLSPHFIQPDSPIYKRLEENLLKFQQFDQGSIAAIGYNHPGENEIKRMASQLMDWGNKTIAEFNKIKPTKEVNFKKRYYIPILRGMRPLSSANNSYQDQTVTDYFPGFSSKNSIFTGLELYGILKKKLLGHPEGRKEVRDFEEFLSKNFFASKQVTLIPLEGDNRVHIQTGNEDQFPIHQLGDGLQSLLICIFNIFMEKEPCLFFIEEPDICMHPSLQRAFLEALISHPQHQYFITTHSNHLLDMAYDYSNTSIFQFLKVSENPISFKIRKSSFNDRDLLRDIGARNSSVFLTNATIWVEGITDRLYFRAYMAKYLKELKEDSEEFKKFSTLKEDIHYSFVEYQGSTLVHWSFNPDNKDVSKINACFTCAHAFLIADRDSKSKRKTKKSPTRGEIYTEMLGEPRVSFTKGKEIENSIPEEILKHTVKAFLEINYPGENKDFSKEIEKISYRDYFKVNVGIGAYLDELFGERKFTKESGTCDNSKKSKKELKTIDKKKDFCQIAVEIMNNPNVEWTLPQELKDICKKVFDHIYEQNKSNLPSS